MSDWAGIALEVDVVRIARGLRLVAEELRVEADAAGPVTGAVTAASAGVCAEVADGLEEARDVAHLIHAGALLIESVHQLGQIRAERHGAPTWGR